MNGSRDETIEKLRKLSDELDKDPLAEFKETLFPGWDIEVENNNELLVKNAARAILAKDVSPDDGTFVSQKELAALLHYIADMME